MDNKQIGKQLAARTKKFAISIISLSASMPNSQESKVIRNQITKPGTSIEANELLAIFTSIGAKLNSKL